MIITNSKLKKKKQTGATRRFKSYQSSQGSIRANTCLVILRLSSDAIATASIRERKHHEKNAGKKY
jgi:hypothetical protein